MHVHNTLHTYQRYNIVFRAIDCFYILFNQGVFFTCGARFKIINYKLLHTMFLSAAIIELYTIKYIQLYILQDQPY